jgi:acyl carrier protein
MTVDKKSIEDTVKQFICREFGIASDDLNATTPLFTSRLLRSLDIVNTILMVEQEYLISIVSLDVGIEQFDTVENIASFVRARLAER